MKILQILQKLLKEKTPFEKLLSQIKNAENITDEKLFFIIKDVVKKDELHYIVKVATDEHTWLWIEFDKAFSECLIKYRRGKKTLGILRNKEDIDLMKMTINTKIDKLYPEKSLFFINR
jgi:hypothetical protein